MKIEQINNESVSTAYCIDGTAAIDTNAKIIESSNEKTYTDKEMDKNQTGNKTKNKNGFRYGAYLFVKRAFDIISSGLVLIIFSWLILICMLI
ncbi:MAG: hypothetical protein ACI4L9_02645, partial [Candidatus Coproplasma sp.]